MAKKKSKTTIVEELLQTAINSSWCIVDVNNNFTYENGKYIIDENVKQYIVLNKPKRINNVWNDWTNESSMSTIFCVDNGDELRFFDENLVEVNSDGIKIGK